MRNDSRTVRGIVGGMDTAQHVEVACNAFLRWLLAICGADVALTILRGLVEHLEKQTARPPEPSSRASPH